MRLDNFSIISIVFLSLPTISFATTITFDSEGFSGPPFLPQHPLAPKPLVLMHQKETSRFGAV